jgi:hypothetical protein
MSDYPTTDDFSTLPLFAGTAPKSTESRFSGTSTTARLAASDVLTPVAGVRETSRAAAKSVVGDSATIRRRVLAVIEERGAYGATDEEIQNSLGLNGNTVRPRRGELQTAGLVRHSGGSRATQSGRKAVVWIAVKGAGK